MKTTKADSLETQRIGKEIVRMFRPGRKVDMVFYTGAEIPDVRPVIIHDCDHESKTLLISQTNPVIHSSTKYEKIGVTTLVSEKSKNKERVGLECKIHKFIKDYALNDEQKEDAISIKYSGQMERYNIREAYRYEPPIDYEVTGKIIHDQDIFQTGDDFKVHNISIGGVGIIVKNLNEKVKNPLLQMPLHEAITAEFNLIDFDSMVYDKSVFAAADIVWKNPSFSMNYGYIGMQFVKPDKVQISELHKFIHNGQLISIRMIKGYNL